MYKGIRLAFSTLSDTISCTRTRIGTSLSFGVAPTTVREQASRRRSTMPMPTNIRVLQNFACLGGSFSNPFSEHIVMLQVIEILDP